MSDRIRRGMLIKNNGAEAAPDEEAFIPPGEGRRSPLRRALQERSIAIVRPATPAEDEALSERLDAQ